MRTPLFLAGIAALLLGRTAQAFTFTPMSVSFDPTGAGATRSFQVDNDSDATIAIEVFIAERHLQLDGEETQPRTAEAEKKFLVYPPQLTLKPKEKRTIRVTWNGEKEPPRELAYRIVAEQLPVQTEKKKVTNNAAEIKMLLKYVGSVYITPPGALAAVRVKAAGPSSAKSKARLLEIDIENSGNAHQVLAPARVRLKSGGKAIELGESSLALLRGQNVLAASTRRFSVPWPTGLPLGTVQVTLEQ